MRAEKRTQKGRPTDGTDRGQLAEQLQKAAIVVALLERSHQQPWLARLGGRDGRPERGGALGKVQPLEQRRIVEELFALCGGNDWYTHYFCCVRLSAKECGGKEW